MTNTVLLKLELMGYFLAVCSTYNTFPQNYREKSLLVLPVRSGKT